MNITTFNILDGSITSRNYTEDELKEIAETNPTVIVPQSITTAQGHLALIEYGKYQAAVDFINSVTDPIEKLKIEVNFYRRNDWERNNPTLLMLAEKLGITNEELDQMFIFGSSQK